MSTNETIKLPEGYKLVNTLPEMHQMISDVVSLKDIQCYAPVSQEYPAHSQFPCVAKVYIDAEHCVRIVYFPLALYKEVIRMHESSLKEQINSLSGIKVKESQSVKLVENTHDRYTLMRSREELVAFLQRYQVIHRLNISDFEPITYPVRYPCLVNVFVNQSLPDDVALNRRFVISAVHMGVESNAFYINPEKELQKTSLNPVSKETTEVVGYYILMQDSISCSEIRTKQFYGRGSIVNIMNRAFDCVGIFGTLENKYQWHLATAIPLTEQDLEEFATLTHIPDA